MEPAASTSLFSRRAGVLAHVSSLPGPATLGEPAIRFLDWCAAAGLSLWQVLPLGPPGPGNSPYSGTSAFAGNPQLYPGSLERDWRRFERDAGEAERRELEAFVDSPERAVWLADWTLYSALKEQHDGRAWPLWDPELRRRDAVAIRSAERRLDERRRFHAWVQYALDIEARRTRAAAEERGIVWVGDLPFYVALDSADVWARREFFRVDGDGHPEATAGFPPDAFSDDGQCWNHPLFNWATLAEHGYDWWIARCRAALGWVHALRLDHFRGYRSFWEIPPHAATAAAGRWLEGPGDTLFEYVREAGLNDVLFAEDLGKIDDDVHRLRERYGFPRMHVLQFGLDDETSLHHPSNHEPHAVACTGTHDNDTFAGWFDSLDEATQVIVREQLGSNSPPALAAVECAWASPAAWAVAPLQDLLGLGSEARMNRPGQADGQWGWRCPEGALTDDRAARLQELARRHGRI
jgi:4-alpha-glucanotransferase